MIGYLIVALFFVASFAAGLFVGLKLQTRDSAGSARNKRPRSKYNPGNLLDPITPEEQRLDRKTKLATEEDIDYV